MAVAKPAMSGSVTVRLHPSWSEPQAARAHARTHARTSPGAHGDGVAVQPPTTPTFHLGRLVHLLSSGVSIRALSHLFTGLSLASLLSSGQIRRRVLPTLPPTGLEVVLFLVFFGVITVYMQTHQSLQVTTSPSFSPPAQEFRTLALLTGATPDTCAMVDVHANSPWLFRVCATSAYGRTRPRESQLVHTLPSL